MTQEEKQLLLRDLCTRLPYGLQIHITSDECDDSFRSGEFDNTLRYHHLEAFVCDRIEIKPYLRPMSSMTEEEIEFMGENGFRVYKKTNCFDNNCDVYDDGWDNFYVDKQSFEGVIELFYSHHFDYRGLIEKGLALEAPEGMYKTK